MFHDFALFFIIFHDFHAFLMIFSIVYHVSAGFTTCQHLSFSIVSHVFLFFKSDFSCCSRFFMFTCEIISFNYRHDFSFFHHFSLLAVFFLYFS